MDQLVRGGLANIENRFSRQVLRLDLLTQFRGKGMSTQVVEANKKDASGPSAVRFSTMHRAKGLEFDQVLVLAPDRFLGPPVETTDERRLLYVAITRAKRAAALVTF